LIAPSEPPSVLVEPKKRGGSVFVQNKRRRPSLPLTTGVAQLFAPAPPLPSSQSQPHPPTLPSPPLLLRRRTPRPGAEPLGRDVHGVVQPACHQGTLVGGPGRCTEMGGLRLWGGLLGLLSDGMSGTPPPPATGKRHGDATLPWGHAQKKCGKQALQVCPGPPESFGESHILICRRPEPGGRSEDSGSGQTKGTHANTNQGIVTPMHKHWLLVQPCIGGKRIRKGGKKSEFERLGEGRGHRRPGMAPVRPPKPCQGSLLKSGKQSPCTPGPPN